MDHVENLREWMKNEGYDGIVLSRRDNFTWVSGGAKKCSVHKHRSGNRPLCH